MRCLSIISLMLASEVVSAADKPAIVELFEDDAAGLVSQLTNNGGDSAGSPADPDERDFFAGVRSLRVAPMQRYGDRIKDWSFRIVEKPDAGQFRYVRFAWKKTGGNSLMVQFHGSDPVSWEHRYFAGSGVPPWQSIKISESTPEDWVVVTRDLWTDFGNLTITGMAFTPIDGTHGHFDHVLLGRSVADLDGATAAVLRKSKPLGLNNAAMRQLWERLGESDSIVEATIWKFIRERDLSGTFLKDTVVAWKPASVARVEEKDVAKLIVELKHHRFTVREAAMSDLLKLGAPAIRFIEKERDREQGAEIKERLSAAVKRLEASDPRTADRKRLLAAVRVLAWLGTPDAKEALDHLSRKPFQEIGVAEAAGRALETLQKR